MLSDSWIYLIHPANVNPAVKFYNKNHYELFDSNIDIKNSLCQVYCLSFNFTDIRLRYSC